MKIALENNLSSIAFPAISCGAYGFPIDKACKIAVNEVVDFFRKNEVEIKVFFVCFDEKLERALNMALVGSGAATSGLL